MPRSDDSDFGNMPAVPPQMQTPTLFFFLGWKCSSAVSSVLARIFDILKA